MAGTEVPRRVAARPAALARLAAAEHDRAARLAVAAGALQAARLGEVAATLAAHARAAHELAGWVADVAVAMARAGGDGAAEPWPLQRTPTRLVEVFGDLGRARRIAVVVPGVGTTVANEATTLRADAGHLWEAASALDPDVAVVAWLGYEPPGLLRALDGEPARTAGADLTDFVASLPAAASVTVVGHSYGSVVAGEALRAGMVADDVVVTGSPGLGAPTAGALGVAPGHLYALRAPLDAVGWSEAYGRDPTDPRFGAVRLATAGAGDGERTGHSSYFAPGSTSLAGIAAVVTGQTSRLAVVQPSLDERALAIADDAWRGALDPPVDLAQDGAAALDHLLDPVLPFDDARATAVAEASRGVDVLQRLASPDLAGDVLRDAWDVVSG